MNGKNMALAGMDKLFIQNGLKMNFSRQFINYHKDLIYLKCLKMEELFNLKQIRIPKP